MNKYENWLRTINVNVDNKKLSDAEFRIFVRNTVSQLPVSSKTNIELLDEDYDKRNNYYARQNYD